MKCEVSLPYLQEFVSGLLSSATWFQTTSLHSLLFYDSF